MKKKLLIIHPDDNVGVAIEPIIKDEHLEIAGLKFSSLAEIPSGHKIALRKINHGEGIIKYGMRIGSAQTNIEKGSWIHSHNLKTDLAGTLSYQYKHQEKNEKIEKPNLQTFLGYKRLNGRVGTRNEIWIINIVGCVNRSAERIAQCANVQFKHDNFDGVFAYSHQFGCSQLGDDLKNTAAVLLGLAQNPNAGGVLVLGLGCENLQLDQFIGSIDSLDKNRLRYFNTQSVRDEEEEGLKKIEELFDTMKNDKREETPISELTIGVKCGGSDSLSGITANPLVGRITDELTQSNGSVLQTEVPEMFGAEQLLLNRASSKIVFEKTVELINNFKNYFTTYNMPVYENPSPGNKAGGLTTLEEKSLGAIQKGGTAEITEVLDYGEQITQRGLVLVNAPGNDGVSSTAMIASGATLLLFTTGRGTPLGFPVPTIKISTNTTLFENKLNWIDFNAGGIADAEATFEQLTSDLLSLIVNVASGKVRTKNEINGYKEIAIWKNGITL